MKRSKISKFITTLTVFAVFFALAGTMLVQAVVASNQFSEEAFLKVSRSADYTSALINEEKDIKYQFYGDEFTLNDVNNILAPKDIMLVIDVSGSMGWEIGNGDSRIRLTVLKAAAKQFVDTFADKNVRIAITTYSTKSNTPGSFLSMATASNVTSIKSQIDGLSANGSTNIGDGIRRAYYSLSEASDADTSKYMVIMTDGEPNYFTSKTSIYNYNQYKDITSYIKLTSGSAYYAYGQNENHGLYYAKKCAELIKLNAQMSPFVVGVSSGTSDSNLEAIGAAGGAAVNPANSKHFYKALTGDDIMNVYNSIAIQIDNQIPFKSTSIDETLPLGVIPVTDLLPAGITAQQLANGQYKLTGSVSNIKLKKNDNGTYQVEDTAVNIRVKFTTPGLKTFGSDTGTVNYVDPFSNSKSTSIQGQFSVLVGNPVAGLSTISDKSIEKGTSVSVTANIAPSTATDYNVEWWMDNNLIAKVDSNTTGTDGTLTANIYGVDIGTTKLNLKVKDNISGVEFNQTCNITVGIKVTSVSELANLKIEKGSIKKASVDILPVNASSVKYKWSITDSTIAILDGKSLDTTYSYDGTGKINANVKGLKVGTTNLKLTVTDEFGNNVYTKECTVDVGVSLDTVGQLNDDSIIRGNQKEFAVSVLPQDASHVTYKISVADSTILELSSAGGSYDGSGKIGVNIKGLKMGTTTLTIVITDNFSNKEITRQCNISVGVPVTGIEGAKDITIAAKTQKVVTANVLPADAVNYTVEWSLVDNDANVAKIVETTSKDGVLSAKIEGVNSGTAKLKLHVKDGTTGNEWTEYSFVTVGVPIESVGNAQDLSINKSRTKTVNIIVNPTEASHVTFECSVLDLTVAKIVEQKYENGVIKITVEGVKHGTTKLNIKVTDKFIYDGLDAAKTFDRACTIKVWDVDIQ